MKKILALLTLFTVSSASAQTTFIQQKKSGARVEIEITGQAGEPALRDLLKLAQNRAYPQKLADGKAFDFDLGTLTKRGKGLRVHLSGSHRDLKLKRKGRRATLTLRKELAQSLYRLLVEAGWEIDYSAFYIAASPSRTLQCDRNRVSDEIYCIVFLKHVFQ